MRVEENSQGVLTFAFGKPKYVAMAKSLARSLILNAPTERRGVVTDSPDLELRCLFDVVIPYRPELGTNVRQKIHIDQYSPFERTLFIDSDSLVLRSLEPIWKAFHALPFGAVGHTILHAGDHDEHLNLEFLLRHLSLHSLPKFNGGIYCFDRSLASTAFFATARDLLNRAHELRFKDFRGDGPADESIYATAMALHGLTLTDMSPGGMWTPIAATTPIDIDVLRGVCRFDKNGVLVQPEIMHFATWTESFLYLRECRKLEKVAATSYSIEPKSWLCFSELLSLRFRVAALRLRKAYFGAIRRLGQLAARL